MSKEEIEKIVKDMFEKADMDGNGELEFSEFQIATIDKRSILQDDKLKEAFRLFDKDQSGAISAEEVKKVLGIGKKGGSMKIWDSIVKEVDQNGDGEIQFEEFKYMMQKFLNEEIKN